MQLYILRHGIAEEKGSKQKDPDRALTGEGKKKLAAVLNVAARAGVAPAIMNVDPKLIASDALAAEALGYSEPPMEVESLEPHGSPEGVWNDVRDHRAEESVLLAGHEPLLGQVVAYLLGTPALQLEFRKGAMVCLTVENFRGEPHGVLEWILTPRLANG